MPPRFGRARWHTGVSVVTRPVGFDLDMTLIDSRPAIMAAFGALSDELGALIDLEHVNRRLGVKLEDELAYWFDTSEIPAAATVFRRHYVALAVRCTPPMPGAHAALAAVRAAGNSSAIITAKHHISVAPCLMATGIQADQVFTFVHGPEKSAVLRQISAAVFVGDTPDDMIAATTAGTVALGVATGSFTAADLTEADASAVLRSLEEFPAWYSEFRDSARCG